MTLLPIVGRELRVAARKWGTYWTRVIAAGVALLIFSGIVLISELTGSAAGKSMLGGMIFQTFSWMSFVFVCAAGVFFTSDSLSEEKRDGTLGLLFLTDLRGFDVVLGKMAACSLRGAYGLIAALPVFGLSFLLGGVTGEQFWRLVLLLGNAMFFSLAIGVFVSAISRDAQRAMNATLGLCLMFLVLFPLADWWIADWDATKLALRFRLASPSQTLLDIGGGRFSSFWPCMGVTHGVAWTFLAAACLVAPRAWQEKAVRSEGPVKRRWRFGSPEKRAAWRRRLCEGNPVCWLAARDRWQSRMVLVAMLALTGLYVAIVAAARNGQVAFMLAHALIFLLALLFALWLASHASRFFLDATRTGALELMLATPLPARDVVRGQVWALVRTFLVPFLLLLAGKIALGVVQLVEVWKNFAVSNPATGANNTWTNEIVLQQIISLGLGLVRFLSSTLAVAWFGMWMGLTSRKPNTAVLKTLVFVYVLPWMVLMFLFWMTFAALGAFMARAGGTFGVGFLMWIPSLVTGVLSVVVDLVFFFIARRKLTTQFREVVARAAGAKLAKKPPAPPASPAPPVLPAPPPLPAPA